MPYMSLQNEQKNVMTPVLQSLMTEWLRWLVNLGVMPPVSDWKVVGSNPTAGMSRIRVLIQGRNFTGYPLPKLFRIYSPPNKITLWPICSHELLL